MKLRELYSSDVKQKKNFKVNLLQFVCDTQFLLSYSVQDIQQLMVTFLLNGKTLINTSNHDLQISSGHFIPFQDNIFANNFIKLKTKREKVIGKNGIGYQLVTDNRSINPNLTRFLELFDVVLIPFPMSIIGGDPLPINGACIFFTDDTRHAKEKLVDENGFSIINPLVLELPVSRFDLGHPNPYQKILEILDLELNEDWIVDITPVMNKVESWVEVNLFIKEAEMDFKKLHLQIRMADYTLTNLKGRVFETTSWSEVLFFLKNITGTQIVECEICHKRYDFREGAVCPFCGSV